MRRALLLLAACGSPESREAPPVSPPTKPAPKPPDDMDERMRHCPLALDGARSTLEDVGGGVRFTIEVPTAAIAEVRKRAHHVVEFSARRSSKGHSEFDGKGGGRMKNCPVVTDAVTIAVTEIPTGVQLDVTSTDVAGLRAETRARAQKFPFVGATIAIR